MRLSKPTLTLSVDAPLWRDHSKDSTTSRRPGRDILSQDVQSNIGHIMRTWYQFKNSAATRYGSGSEGEARPYYRDLDAGTFTDRFMMTRLPFGDEPPKDALQCDMAIELAKTARPR